MEFHPEPQIRLQAAPKGGLSSAFKAGSNAPSAPTTRRLVPSPGSEALREQFYLPQGSRYFNASYGNVPVPVMQAQWAMQIECETDPQAWMLGKVAMRLRRVRSRLAKMLCAKTEDLVLVENCTSGINAVLRTAPIEEGSFVIHFSTAYGVVKNGMKYAAEKAGATVVEIPVEFHGNSTAPTGPGGMPLVEAVASVVDDAVAMGSKVSLACFDHIASCPGVIMPVMQIAHVCQSRGVPLLLDGAHVLGQHPISLQELEDAGVCYWVSDAHKWLFSPKGSAVLWVSKAKQEHVMPAALGAVVSSSASTANFNPVALEGLSEFERRFQYTGTRDYTPLAAIENAMDFRQSIGECDIIGYNHGMAVWAQRHLAQLWQTEALLPDTQTAAMAHVRLPGVSTKADADFLSDLLKKRFNIHVMFFGLPVIGSPGSMAYWVRPCFQVYVTHADVDALGEAVVDCLKVLPAAKAAHHWRTKAASRLQVAKQHAAAVFIGAAPAMPSPQMPIVPLANMGGASLSGFSPDTVLLSNAVKKSASSTASSASSRAFVN